jgi:hypothetical protein
MAITDRDIHAQVSIAIDASEGTYDVDGITRAIVVRYGLFNIDSIDHDEFWGIVNAYAIDEQDDDSDNQCDGHESLNGADFGREVYCDGSCRQRR